MPTERPTLNPRVAGTFDSNYRENDDSHLDKWCYNGSGSAIAAGDWCEFDTSDTNRLGKAVQQLSATADAEEVIGVALDEIPNGKWGMVRMRGFVESANVATSTAVGTNLQPNGTAGRAGAAGAATERRCGLCLTLAASNAASVWVDCA